MILKMVRKDEFLNFLDFILILLLLLPDADHEFAIPENNIESLLNELENGDNLSQVINESKNPLNFQNFPIHQLYPSFQALFNQKTSKTPPQFRM